MKKLGCLASALLLTLSLASVTYAQGVSSDFTEALMGKIAVDRAKLEENENERLKDWVWNQDKMVSEHIVYDSEGNRVEDETLLHLLEESKNNFSVARGSVAQTCCDNPSPITYYDECHIYQPPTPAQCEYSRYEVIVCRNCVAQYSRTYLGVFPHIHR